MTLLGRMRLNKIHVITFSLSFREDYPVLKCSRTSSGCEMSHKDCH